MIEIAMIDAENLVPFSRGQLPCSVVGARIDNQDLAGRDAL
jgi:hypothetical protein